MSAGLENVDHQPKVSKCTLYTCSQYRPMQRKANIMLVLYINSISKIDK